MRRVGRRGLIAYDGARNAKPAMRRVPVRTAGGANSPAGVSFGVGEDMADSKPTATKLQTPSDHVRVLHREARTGAVAVVHRPGGRWVERAIGLRELEHYVDSLPDGLDCYGSQGRFAGRRRVASLITIDSLWVDVDYHRTARYAASGPADVLYALLGHCDGQGIPAPSYVLGTGRGLCAVWLHDVLPRAALGRWQGVQAALQERFAGFGVDAASRDAARVLRLVGSRNTAADRPVRCLFPAVGEPWRYSIDELASVLLPYRSAGEADRERARRPQRPLAGLRLAATAGRSTSAGPWALWGRRLEDLHALRELRWFGPLPPGHRDRWMFLASVALSWMVPAHLVRREVLHLARQALGGAWTREAVLRDMGAALRRAEAAASGQLVEWPPGSGELVDPRYRFRDGTLVDWLDITPEELALLPTTGQLGPASLAARQAHRGRAGGLVGGAESGRRRRKAVADRDREIGRLRREEGLSPGAIGARLGISRGAALKALARLDNPALQGGDPESHV